MGATYAKYGPLYIVEGPETTGYLKNSVEEFGGIGFHYWGPPYKIHVSMTFISLESQNAFLDRHKVKLISWMIRAGAFSDIPYIFSRETDPTS